MRGNINHKTIHIYLYMTSSIKLANAIYDMLEAVYPKTEELKTPHILTMTTNSEDKTMAEIIVSTPDNPKKLMKITITPFIFNE